MCGPNFSSSAPKSDRLFSPNILPASPPLLGSFDAISARASAALEEAVITSGLMPAISSEYFLKYGPNSASSSPNFTRLVPPVNHLVSPSKIFAAVKSRIVCARALTPCSMAGSIFFAPSMNPWALDIKSVKS